MKLDAQTIKYRYYCKNLMSGVAVRRALIIVCQAARVKH